MSLVEFHRLIIITPNYQKLNRSLSEIVWHSFHLHVHCINKNAAVVSVSEHSNIIGTRPKVQELNDQSCCYKMAGSKPFNCQVIIIIGIGACVWRNQVISEQFLVKIVGFTLKVWRTELLKKQNKCLDQNRKSQRNQRNQRIHASIWHRTIWVTGHPKWQYDSQNMKVLSLLDNRYTLKPYLAPHTPSSEHFMLRPNFMRMKRNVFAMSFIAEIKSYCPSHYI